MDFKVEGAPEGVAEKIKKALEKQYKSDPGLVHVDQMELRFGKKCVHGRYQKVGDVIIFTIISGIIDAILDKADDIVEDVAIAVKDKVDKVKEKVKAKVEKAKANRAEKKTTKAAKKGRK